MARYSLHTSACMLLLAVMLTSCFTGVESTKKITDKDVNKVVQGTTREEREASTLLVPLDSVAVWKPGKRFFVSDNNAALIFDANESYNADTLRLRGKMLDYTGYTLGSVLDNRKTVNLQFSDGARHYSYSTGKTLDELRSGYAVPFLIDMDAVEYVDGKLKGSTCYVKTSIWYGLDEEMTSGRKYVKVKIDSILPGNKVFPIKVVFTDVEQKRQAMVWMTLGETVIKNRSFDALFSLTDIRLKYPDIEDDVWACIVAGKVKVGMTKDEVRMSLGRPANVNERLTYGGIKEYWYYTDGRYLYFEDGLLVK